MLCEIKVTFGYTKIDLFFEILFHDSDGIKKVLVYITLYNIFAIGHG